MNKNFNKSTLMLNLNKKKQNLINDPYNQTIVKHSVIFV